MNELLRAQEDMLATRPNSEPTGSGDRTRKHGTWLSGLHVAAKDLQERVGIGSGRNANNMVVWFGLKRPNVHAVCNFQYAQSIMAAFLKGRSAT